MGEQDRFVFAFTPNFWALPISIGCQRTYYGSGKQRELAVQFGPFNFSIIIGSMEAKRQLQGGE